MIELGAMAKVNGRYGQIKQAEWADIRDTWQAMEAVVRAAQECPTVINDAITKLYPEECSKKTLMETSKRCSEMGGTLAYFVDVRMTLESALKPFQPEQSE